MTFSHKYITCDFSLAQGVFDGGGNTHSVAGLRVSAQIVKAGGLSMGAANLAIYGLPLSTMNQLSTYGQVLTLTGKNTVTVKAGDDPQNLAVVFTGTVQSAYMDGNAQPMVPFRVEAFAGSYESVMPVAPTSKPGAQDGGALMGQIAQLANLQFENNGVSTKITNPYLPGTPRQQAAALAKALGCEWIIDKGTLAIWPPGKTRSGNTKLAPGSGLVGYPIFNSQGVVVVAEFDPTLTYGATVEIQSSITPACGSWVIYKLEYDLESETPGGKWFCEVSAARPGQQPVY